MKVRKLSEFMINVQPGTFFKRCRVRGRPQSVWIDGHRQVCRNKPEFMVFVDDGRPKGSRLDSNCCSRHLPNAIRQARKTNEKLRNDEKEYVVREATRILHEYAEERKSKKKGMEDTS